MQGKRAILTLGLPKVAQAGAGARLRFCWVTLDEGLAVQRKFDATIKALPSACKPLVRDPYDMADLLSYQLISGAVSADTDPFATGENT